MGDEARKMREYARLRGSRRASVSAEVIPTTAVPKPRKLSAKLGQPKTDEEVATLRAALSGNMLFKGLDESQLDMLVISCTKKTYQDGDTIIRQDEGGHLFYIVGSGKLSVHIRDGDSLVQERTVLYYGPGDSFGELALMYNQPRAASVRADEASLLWTLERSTFQAVMQSTNMARSKGYTDCLEAIPLFKNLEREEVSKLVDVMESFIFEDGHIIIRQGDPGETLFVILEGTAVATREPALGESTPVPVKFAAGDFFGEMALLTDMPRAASVKATSKCVVSTLDKETFMRLLGPCEDILQRQVDHIHSLSASAAPSPEPGSGSPPPGPPAAPHISVAEVRSASPQRCNMMASNTDQVRQM